MTIFNINAKRATQPSGSFLQKTKMTKPAPWLWVFNLVIGGRSGVTTLEPHLKSAKKPCDIRIFMMLERGKILSENVISILKIARKCIIFVKAKSAKK